MSVKTIKQKLKRKGIEPKECYASRCIYGGGWTYFIFLGKYEPLILDIDKNAETDTTQFESKEEVYMWIDRLPNLLSN